MRFLYVAEALEPEGVERDCEFSRWFSAGVKSVRCPELWRRAGRPQKALHFPDRFVFDRQAVCHGRAFSSARRLDRIWAANILEPGHRRNRLANVARWAAARLEQLLEPPKCNLLALREPARLPHNLDAKITFACQQVVPPSQSHFPLSGVSVERRRRYGPESHDLDHSRRGWWDREAH
jgi:hypothetical protein